MPGWQSRFVASAGPRAEGDKISLPADCLAALQHHMQSSTALTLRLSSPRVPLGVFATVLDFTAPSRTAVVPGWILRHLEVENGGLLIVQHVDPLETATHCVFEPMTPEFFANSDLRPVLEAALTAQFVTLTKGTVLDLRHGSSVFPIRVADLSPADAVSILDADVEVDVQMPVDDRGQPLFEPAKHGQDAPPTPTPLQSSRGRAQQGRATFHRLGLLAPGVAVRVNVTAQGPGDVEVYAGSMREPSRFSHELTNETGDYLGRACFAVPAHANTGVIYLAVSPYRCDTVEYVVTVESDDGSRAMEVTRPDESLPEGQTQCPNCRQAVPTERLQLHRLHCERHLVFCARCNRGVRPDQHHHCEACAFVASDPAAAAKHADLFHQPTVCVCGATLQLMDVPAHVPKCPARKVVCRFCQIEHIAGPLPSDAVDRLLNFTEHESRCGSRTEPCEVCRQHVRLRDALEHQEMHRMQPPAPVVRPVFAPSSAPSPAGASQATVLPEAVPRDPKPVPVCSSVCCAGVRSANPLGLCAACWTCVVPTGASLPPDAVAKSLVKFYFDLVQSGCGRAACRNEKCRLNSSDTPSKSAAAAAAVGLAQQAPGRCFVCWPQQPQQQRAAADQLVELGFPLDWAVLALTITGDTASAVTWLLSHFQPP